MINNWAFLALLGVAGLMVVMSGATEGRHWRPINSLLAWVGTAAYLAWRYHSIMVLDLAPPQQQWWVRFCFFGEAIFIVEFWVFLLLVSRSSDHVAEAERHERESHDGRALPRVDVFIATYNEELPILEKSICGALALDWPDFTVHVLDDGRRPWLAEYCAAVGAHYIARPDNRDKKAGNHNYALSVTDAPFVAVFDADFVPNQKFLRRTVGFFEDAQVGIVQTPQVFYNTDNFQNSLGMRRVLADDQRFFFRHVMPSRDAWGVAFYVGSSAVLRRSAIAEAGGIVTGMATEDQATSTALLAKGYRTLYLNEALSSGLAPESGFAVVEQRKRWCRGGIQLIFRGFGPFGLETRGVKTRLFFMPTYWILGYLNPLFFLVEVMGCWYLGYTPFVAVDPVEILIGSLATFLLFSSFLYWVGRGTWLPLISPAFHLFMAFSVFPTAATTLIKPVGQPLMTFLEVTPKGLGARSGRINYATLWPLLTIIVLLGFGVVSSVFFPFSLRVNPGENLVLSMWTGLAFTQLFIAFLCCFEPPYLRGEERFSLNATAHVCVDDVCRQVTVTDISLSGARISGLSAEEAEHLIFAGAEIPVRVLHSSERECRVVFENLSMENKRKLIERLFALETPQDTVKVAPFRALWSVLRLLMYGRAERGGG